MPTSASCCGIHEAQSGFSQPSEEPLACESIDVSPAAAAAVASEADHEGSRRLTSQWELNEGTDFPGRPARDSSDDEEDDDSAFQQALHETWDGLDPAIRSKRALIPTLSGKGQKPEVQVVELRQMPLHAETVLDRTMRTRDMDNERFLLKVRARLDAAGVELPKVEVRFRDLDVRATAESAGRALPSIWNFYRNAFEGWLRGVRLLPRNAQQLQVLDGCSGVLRPGRLTLLLGPPASGKTSLLKALAGKLDTKHLEVAGEVTYNGVGIDQFVVGRTASYVGQTDNHIAELTVRETLDFAARCQGGGYSELEELRAKEAALVIKPDLEVDAFMRASARSGKRHSIRTDYTLRMLGLDVCADTLVGSQLTRGISGGQKKRLTTGTHILGPCRALFMDEISTGLDSSTTYQIVRCIRNVSTLRDATVVVSLLQPPPETFDLFEDIILLADGIIVYHGPSLEVIAFFEGLGFHLPPRKGVADFLQEITSRKDQKQYWAAERPWRFVSPAAMAEAFSLTALGRARIAELDITPEVTDKGRAALATARHELSLWGGIKACGRREATLMWRNRVVYLYRLAQLVFVAAVAGTTFLKTRMQLGTIDAGRPYLACLFYSTYFMQASGYSELSITLQTQPVFYKHRDNLFFQTTAYMVPIAALRIPYSIVFGVGWSCIFYYTVGMAPEWSRFLYFMLVAILLNQVSIGVFRLTAAAFQGVVISNTMSFVFVGCTMLFNGFIIRAQDMGWWVRWVVYINPMYWMLKGLTLNEFLAPRWDVPPPPGTPAMPGQSLGQALLSSVGFNGAPYWRGLTVPILFAMMIIVNVATVLCYRFLDEPNQRRAVIPPERLVSERDDASAASRGRSKGGQLSAKALAAVDMAEAGLKGPAGSLSDATRQPPNTGAYTDDATSMGHGLVLPFEPITVTFRDVRYFVPLEGGGELELLKGITGAFRPGVLTALMGASGAGKTTFMDCLVGRKTAGHITGDVRVNGHPQVHSTFARISGYCEQNDIHSPQATVHEALWFSARLRLGPEVNNADCARFISEVMALVELTPLTNALVGLPGVSGLSVEQRKRLTIAVELVANPAIVFMDEPTSGLDARAAAIVMRVVRNIVNTGRTITCTIHQPAIDIFETFDELLLLKRGGSVIFNGPLGTQSSSMISYFQQLPMVPPIADGYNPATWMLDISTITAEAKLAVDLAQVYAASQQARDTDALVGRLEQPEPGSVPLAFSRRYPQSLLSQYLVVLTKNFVCYWRYPTYNAVRFTYTFVTSIVLGLAFWQVGQDRSTEKAILRIIASQYWAAIIVGFVNSATIQPITAIERPVFYRERAAGFYNTIAYAVAQGTVETPFAFVQCLIYVPLTYFIIGFEYSAAKFFWYFLFVFVTLLYYTFYGLMAVVLSPSIQLSSVASTLFYAIWSLFAGFLISRNDLPPWWKWYGAYLNPVAWTVYGLCTTQLGDVTGQPVALDNGGITTVSQYLEDRFGFYYGMRGWCAFILVGFIAVFRIASIAAVRILVFQKR